jgi:hypothetical protein
MALSKNVKDAVDRWINYLIYELGWRMRMEGYPKPANDRDPDYLHSIDILTSQLNALITCKDIKKYADSKTLDTALVLLDSYKKDFKDFYDPKLITEDNFVIRMRKEHEKCCHHKTTTIKDTNISKDKK